MSFSEGFRRRRSPLAGAGVGLLLTVGALGTLILFPYPLFPHRSRFGSIDLGSDVPAAPGIDTALQAAHRRILAMPLHLPNERYELFLAHRERLYGLFALLPASRPPLRA